MDHITLSEHTAVSITQIDATNQSIGPEVIATAPTKLSGINRIEITMPPGRRLPKLEIIEVLLLNAKGEPLDALLFNE